MRQHHGQVFFGHWHRAVLFAMDDGDRRAPVALAAHTPVAQTPSGLLFAQALDRQGVRHSVDRVFHRQAAETVGVDGHALLLVGVPVVPLLVIEMLAIHVYHLDDGQGVFEGKRKVAFVMGGHAHHCTIAITHQHVVADPHGHLMPVERMGNEQARGHALLLLGGEFSFGRAAGLAFFDEGCQRGVAQCRMLRQGVLRRHGAKGHAHDRVGTGGEHIHASIVDQLTIGAFDLVGEGESARPRSCRSSSPASA